MIQTVGTGKLVVITGPSGVGKGTLVRSLLKRHPDIYLSVSMTTRSPRPGEVNGKDYFFVTPEKFQDLIAAEQLLEWAQFAGNYYGTPRQQVEEKIKQGILVLLEIELEGARQICASFPEALRLFILPPSMSELERRLRDRQSESPEAITRRLNRAIIEIAAADEFDVQIVNDDFDRALAEVELVLFPGLPELSLQS
ncbi:MULTISPECIES: guanylate kinase [unclassified Roseofilum]|uniref:guanylate kinase n=1 Tax=unclassified Roseofilum TaxID=2620099 RepID=UPI001AFDC6F9|nr:MULTISPECIES: guanylate kinase [unclassified Roseofilum]MBP0007105.1 guanylate kinase [Roseofilum sp. Belize Diploria]MBP0032132.1 guanylate kinase [Roseofilum sp. Belize BBD 4]